MSPSNGTLATAAKRLDQVWEAGWSATFYSHNLVKALEFMTLMAVTCVPAASCFAMRGRVIRPHYLISQARFALLGIFFLKSGVDLARGKYFHNADGKVLAADECAEKATMLALDSSTMLLAIAEFTPLSLGPLSATVTAICNGSWVAATGIALARAANAAAAEAKSNKGSLTATGYRQLVEKSVDLGDSVRGGIGGLSVWAAIPLGLGAAVLPKLPETVWEQRERIARERAKKTPFDYQPFNFAATT